MKHSLEDYERVLTESLIYLKDLLWKWELKKDDTNKQTKLDFEKLMKPQPNTKN